MLHVTRRAWRLTKVPLAFALAIGIGILLWHTPSEIFGQAKAKGKPAKPEAAQPDIGEDIDEAIRQLEAGEFAAFIDRYAPVEFLREVRKRDQVAEVSRMLDSQPQAKITLLNVLKVLKKQKPQFDKSHGLATYQYDPTESGAPAVAPAELHIVDTSAETAKLAGLGDDLPKVLTEAIRLLEAEKIADFAERIFPASEVIRLRGDGQMKSLVQQFKVAPDAAAGAEKPVDLRSAMIADFKRMQGAKPELDKSGALATYKLAAADKLPARTVKLQKVGRHWRLFDDSPRVANELQRQSKLKAPGAVETVILERLGGNWRLVAFPAMQGAQ